MKSKISRIIICFQREPSKRSHQQEQDFYREEFVVHKAWIRKHQQRKLLHERFFFFLRYRSIIVIVSAYLGVDIQAKSVFSCNCSKCSNNVLTSQNSFVFVLFLWYPIQSINIIDKITGTYGHISDMLSELLDTWKFKC